MKPEGTLAAVLRGGDRIQTVIPEFKDCICDLVVSGLVATHPEVPGSLHGATRFSEK
jgi:hypothetical protein